MQYVRNHHSHVKLNISLRIESIHVLQNLLFKRFLIDEMSMQIFATFRRGQLEETNCFKMIERLEYNSFSS